MGRTGGQHGDKAKGSRRLLLLSTLQTETGWSPNSGPHLYHGILLEYAAPVWNAAPNNRQTHSCTPRPVDPTSAKHMLAKLQYLLPTHVISYLLVTFCGLDTPHLFRMWSPTCAGSVVRKQADTGKSTAKQFTELSADPVLGGFPVHPSIFIMEMRGWHFLSVITDDWRPTRGRSLRFPVCRASRYLSAIHQAIRGVLSPLRPGFHSLSLVLNAIYTHTYLSLVLNAIYTHTYLSLVLNAIYTCLSLVLNAIYTHIYLSLVLNAIYTGLSLVLNAIYTHTYLSLVLNAIYTHTYLSLVLNAIYTGLSLVLNAIYTHTYLSLVLNAIYTGLSLVLNAIYTHTYLSLVLNAIYTGLSLLLNAIYTGLSLVRNAIYTHTYLSLVLHALYTGLSLVLNAIYTGLSLVLNAIYTGLSLVLNAIYTGLSLVLNAIYTGLSLVLNAIYTHTYLSLVLNAIYTGLSLVLNAIYTGLSLVRNATYTSVLGAACSLHSNSSSISGKKRSRQRPELSICASRVAAAMAAIEGSRKASRACVEIPFA
ncbi:hypothetical protein Bbelb_264540 [Branchiostoma belcheri]|nr:hypothetical protein Bbelb_264540 [Branchiostoma belcheri]